MKNKSKKELIEYIKRVIIQGREHSIDRIIIEDENESDGLYLSIALYRNNHGEGEGINQYRDPFYRLNDADLEGIKEETKIKKIKMKEKEDFGEWVRILEIIL